MNIASSATCVIKSNDVFKCIAEGFYATFGFRLEKVERAETDVPENGGDMLECQDGNVRDAFREFVNRFGKVYAKSANHDPESQIKVFSRIKMDVKKYEVEACIFFLLSTMAVQKVYMIERFVLKTQV